MDQTPLFYRRVIDSVLLQLKSEWLRYGWDEETVMHKLSKLKQVRSRPHATKGDNVECAIHGCLDPSNSPLLPNAATTAALNKALKRKQEKAAEKESKKQARLNNKASVQSSATGSSDGANKPARAPLTYPVLNPHAADEQQMKLQQITNQTPMQAITVMAAAPSSTMAPSASPAAAASPPQADDNENPFESQPLHKRAKTGRKPASENTNSADAAAAVASSSGTEVQPAASSHQFNAAVDSSAAVASSSSSSIPSPATASSSSSVPVSAAAAAPAPAPVAPPIDPEAQQIMTGHYPSQLTSTTLGPEDDDSDDEAALMPPASDDLVMCQFEKVVHLKDRWKVVLRDGILRINKRDFLFSKATGEFEW